MSEEPESQESPSKLPKVTQLAYNTIKHQIQVQVTIPTKLLVTALCQHDTENSEEEALGTEMTREALC